MARKARSKASLAQQTLCTVCQHPDRHRVERARIAGMSLDSLAAKFDLGRHSIWRHCIDHITDEERAMYLADIPLAELAAKAADEGMAIIDYLHLLRSTLFSQIMIAGTVGDRTALAALSGRAHDVLRTMAKVTGEMRQYAPSPSITNNTAVFINSPDFARLQGMLLDRLARFPDARAAVIEGLAELDQEARAASAIALQPAEGFDARAA